MKIRLASPLMPDSILDGEGIRTVIWTQGCMHNCKGCHNPETHDFKKGFSTTTEEVNKELDQLKNQTGITLSGGDPFFQPKACTIIAKHAHEKGLNVWAYTGFLYEDITKSKEMSKLLQTVDVLVDGKFEIDKKSYNVPFRGSTNQRIIDVKKSLEQNRVVEIEKYITKEETNKKQQVFI